MGRRKHRRLRRWSGQLFAWAEKLIKIGSAREILGFPARTNLLSVMIWANTVLPFETSPGWLVPSALMVCPVHLIAVTPTKKTVQGFATLLTSVPRPTHLPRVSIIGEERVTALSDGLAAALCTSDPGIF